LYAAANPWTLSDPTGHFFEDLNLNPFDHIETIANIGVTVAVAAATTAVAGTIGLGAVAVGAAVGAASSVASDLASGQGLRLESALSGAAAGATFVIVAGVTKNVTLAGAASGAVGNVVNQGIAYAASGGRSGFDPGQVALSAAAGGAFGLFGSKVGAAVSGPASRGAGWGTDAARSFGAGKSLFSSQNPLSGASRFGESVRDIGREFAIRRTTRSVAREVDDAIEAGIGPGSARLGAMGAGPRERFAAFGRNSARHRGNIVDTAVKTRLSGHPLFRGGRVSITRRGQSGVDFRSTTGARWDMTTRRQFGHHHGKYPGARLVGTTYKRGIL